MPITIPTKPTAFRFAWNNPSERSSLTLAEEESGYDVALMKPSRKKFNYMFYTVGEWTQYLSSGGASIQFLDNDDPITTIEAIEDIDISNVESGAWLYGKAGVYTFYPLMPSPPSSTEYIIKPTTPLAGNMGAWILTIPNMDTVFGLAQEEVDRVESKVDNYITNNDIIVNNLVSTFDVDYFIIQSSAPSSAFTSINSNDYQERTFTLNNIPIADKEKYFINCKPVDGLPNQLVVTQTVLTADNTVTVRINNYHTGAQTPPAQNYLFAIVKSK